MADRANIYIYQGTDFQTPLYFYDADGPIDVSDYTFYSQIRKMYSESKIGVDFTFLMEDPVNGKVEMTMQDSVSMTLEPGKYQFDVMAVHPTDEITKVLEGLIFVEPTVTKIGFAGFKQFQNFFNINFGWRQQDFAISFSVKCLIGKF